MTREDKILDLLSKAMTENLGLNIPVRVAIMRHALDQDVSISNAVNELERNMTGRETGDHKS